MPMMDDGCDLNSDLNQNTNVDSSGSDFDDMSQMTILFSLLN